MLGVLNLTIHPYARLRYLLESLYRYLAEPVYPAEVHF